MIALNEQWHNGSVVFLEQQAKLTLVNWIRYLVLQLHDDDNYCDADGVHVYEATPPNRWSVVSLAPSLMADKLDLAHLKPHCCHCIIPHCSTLSLLTTSRPIQIRQQFAAFDVLFL